MDNWQNRCLVYHCSVLDTTRVIQRREGELKTPPTDNNTHDTAAATLQHNDPHTHRNVTFPQETSRTTSTPKAKVESQYIRRTGTACLQNANNPSKSLLALKGPVVQRELGTFSPRPSRRPSLMSPDRHFNVYRLPAPLRASLSHHHAGTK